MIREMDWEQHLGKPVRIYRNLNNFRMSLQVKQGKSWIVVGHVTEAVIQSVTFKVQESGRQRVLRDRQKNVHAWGQGTLVAQCDDAILATIDLAYDPYQNTSFVQRGTSHPIVACQYLVVRNNQVFVSADAVKSSAEQPNLFSLDFDLFTPALLAA